MNHEHSPENYQPRHRASADGEHRDPTGDAYVADIIDHAPTEEAEAILAEVYARHGTAFAVYLASDDVDHYSPDTDEDRRRGMHRIEADFKDSYYGCFADREMLIDDTIASFDWATDARRLLEGHPELQEFLVFDRDAIWGFINDHYDITELPSGLYAFERWP